MEKWLYRELANYRVVGTENASVVQCALGTHYVWIGSLSTIAGNDYRAIRLSLHQPSYNKQEFRQFTSKEEALAWIIDLIEAELAVNPNPQLVGR